jgi:hypothetical protein
MCGQQGTPFVAVGACDLLHVMLESTGRFEDGAVLLFRSS